MTLDTQSAIDQLGDPGEDGIVIDSITGAGTSLEADAAKMTVKKYSEGAYSQGMKELLPTMPLLQMPPESPPDAMALDMLTMKFRYIESTISAHDEDGTSGEGWGAGVSKTVSEPIVIQVIGGTVFVSFPKYGFDRDFKGTLVGTVR